MKKIISIIFILSVIARNALAWTEDYTVTTKSYVTRKTCTIVACGSSSDVTANTQLDISCYLSPDKTLKGSIVVVFNNVQNTLDSAHSSFTQPAIPAIINEAGLYGFVEFVDGRQIQNKGPYLLTCNLFVKED